MGYGRFVAGGRGSLLRGPVLDQAVGFITAPSMPTPWVTFFHNATRRLRASATTARLRLLSFKPGVRGACGWLRIHSQANWIIVVRSLGLPAFDTPCSCRMPPLGQGVPPRRGEAAAWRRLANCR